MLALPPCATASKFYSKRHAVYVKSGASDGIGVKINQAELTWVAGYIPR